MCVCVFEFDQMQNNPLETTNEYVEEVSLGRRERIANTKISGIYINFLIVYVLYGVYAVAPLVGKETFEG